MLLLDVLVLLLVLEEPLDVELVLDELPELLEVVCPLDDPPLLVVPGPNRAGSLLPPQAIIKIGPSATAPPSKANRVFMQSLPPRAPRAPGTRAVYARPGLRRQRCYAPRTPMNLDLNANSLLASMLVSSIGFVSFAYGKKQRRPPQMIVGLALMIFPYFVSSVPWMFGIAAALIAALVVMLKVRM